MIGEWFFARLKEWGHSPALVAAGQRVTYAELLQASDAWCRRFGERGVCAGAVVAIEGGFSLQACGAFLAAMQLGAVVAPLTPLMRAHREKFLEIAEASLLVELDDSDAWTLVDLGRGTPGNELILALRERQHPGLVIFSSGS